MLARAWDLGWKRGQEQGTASLTHLHSPTGKDTEGKANKIFKVEVSQVFTKSPNFPSSSLLEITKQNKRKTKLATTSLQKLEYEKVRETTREGNRSDCLLELNFEEPLNEANWSCPCTEGGNNCKEHLSDQINLILISTW